MSRGTGGLTDAEVGEKIVIFALAVYISLMNGFGKNHLQEKR